MVEPLTKKQFLTFDGFDDIKKQMATMKAQQEEAITRIDKVIRRNETFDRLDKYCREIVTYLVLSLLIGTGAVNSQGCAAERYSIDSRKDGDVGCQVEGDLN